MRRSISRRSIGASVSVSKALSGFSAPSRCRRLGHQHQVLDADAVGARLVIAGLVREDHAGLERRVCRAWRCAAGPRAPTGSCRRRGRCRDRSRGRPATDAARASGSSCAPVVPSGKPRVAMAMWPLSTRVKRSRISARRLADRDRARDVGGAVLDIARRNRPGTVRRRDAAVGLASVTR